MTAQEMALLVDGDPTERNSLSRQDWQECPNNRLAMITHDFDEVETFGDRLAECKLDLASLWQDFKSTKSFNLRGQILEAIRQKKAEMQEIRGERRETESMSAVSRDAWARLAI